MEETSISAVILNPEKHIYSTPRVRALFKKSFVTTPALVRLYFHRRHTNPDVRPSYRNDVMHNSVWLVD